RNGPRATPVPRRLRAAQRRWTRRARSRFQVAPPGVALHESMTVRQRGASMPARKTKPTRRRPAARPVRRAVGTRAPVRARPHRANPRGARLRPTAADARLIPIGVISSTLRSRGDAPRQGSEGAPDAWLEVHAWAAEALDGIAVGDELLVITWFHQAR